MLFLAQSINHINIIINFRENKVFCSGEEVILGWDMMDILFCLLGFVYAVE
jgi:hypothetical protein